MRTITSAMQAAFAGGTTDAAVMFLSIAFPDSTFRVWTGGVGSVTWSSQTWIGLAQVLRIEPAAETSDGTAQQLTITMAPLTVDTAGDPADDLLTRLAGLDPRGSAVNLWVGFITEAGAVVADPLHVFSGFLDQRVVEDGGETVELRFLCVSELEDGDRETRFRLSRSRSAARGFSSDKFFAHIPDVEDIEIKWPGKGYWERKANNN